MKKIIILFVVSLVFSCMDKAQKVVESSKLEITINQLENGNLSGGTLNRINNFSSKYIKPRPVDIWLPENYSKEKKYSVLYMHDGQMLFDSTTTWNKQEWKVDEIASRLMKERKTKDFIVVAVWNISKLRNSNYFPQKVYEIMSQKDKDSLFSTGIAHKWTNTINSDDYLKFIVKELKPYIDSQFSTFSDANNTSILGSSRGGLISMYAICEYPEVFGAAACLSTHWIGTYSNENNHIPNAFFDYMKVNLPESNTHNLYFDYGTETLDALYLKYQEKVSQILASKGYSTNLKFENSDHSENSWSQRLDIPLTFLLGK